MVTPGSRVVVVHCFHSALKCEKLKQTFVKNESVCSHQSVTRDDIISRGPMTELQSLYKYFQSQSFFFFSSCRCLKQRVVISRGPASSTRLTPPS